MFSVLETRNQRTSGTEIRGTPDFPESLNRSVSSETPSRNQSHLELGEIKSLEKQVYAEVKSSNPEIIDNINDTGKLDEEVEKKLTSIIEQFKKKGNK